MTGPKLEALIREISPTDSMLGGYADPEVHYFGVGESALHWVRQALASAGVGDPETILDLPCGHGRVLRYLRAAFPEAQLSACDIDREGVDFCARTFAALPVYSQEAPEEIPLDGPFDLIWCGSLLTHVPAPRWGGFLRRFSSLLSATGVLVFTTHGRTVAEWAGRGDSSYGLDAERIRSLLEGYRRDGFGFATYPQADGYGISLSSPSWVLRQLEQVPGARLVLYAEAVWDDHQDVVAWAKIDSQRGGDSLTEARHDRVLGIIREIEEAGS